MKVSFLFIILSINCLISTAQQSTIGTRGTIKVEKKNLLSQIQYDNVNSRLIGIDQYGNVLDSAVVSFRIKVTIKEIAYDELTEGSYLSKKMQLNISRIDKETFLFFSEIMIKDKMGNLINFGSFKTRLGFSYKNED